MRSPLVSRWFGVQAAFATLLLLGACVTINVYFPAAAAEQAADRIIDQVYGAPQSAAPQQQNRRSHAAPEPGLLLAAAGRVLDFVVPRAHAQQPDINVETAAIRALVAAMQARQTQLAPYYASGAIGIGADGSLEIRDQNAIPLPERNAVRRLVSDENADRASLYAEIARANNRPDWEGEIRATFARRWVDRAQPGWWFRGADGGWQQK